jgi:hypothetical protein
MCLLVTKAPPLQHPARGTSMKQTRSVSAEKRVLYPGEMMAVLVDTTLQHLVPLKTRC